MTNIQYLSTISWLLCVWCACVQFCKTCSIPTCLPWFWICGCGNWCFCTTRTAISRMVSFLLPCFKLKM